MNKQDYGTKGAVDDMTTLRHNLVQEFLTYAKAHNLAVNAKDEAELADWLRDVITETFADQAEREDADNAGRSLRINGADLVRLQKEQLV